MSAKSLFGVVVRAAGFWLLLRGIGGLLSGLIGAAAAGGIHYFGSPGGWLMRHLPAAGSARGRALCLPRG